MVRRPFTHNVPLWLCWKILHDNLQEHHLIWVSVRGTELKLHYYIVNWANVRNYWKITALFWGNFWDFKMHLFSFRERGGNPVFLGKWIVSKCLLCFQLSFWPPPFSLEIIRKSVLEGRNLSRASTTKICVAKKMLSLQPIFKIIYLFYSI